MVPGLTGMSGMHYPQSLLANAAGGIIWGSTFTLLEYFIGTSIEEVTGPASLVLVGIIALAVVGIHLRSKTREPRLGSGAPPRAEAP